MTEQRKQLARGFARFVIRQGSGACCPHPYEKGPHAGEPKTWQARGREIYGIELFNQVMREELATRAEWEAQEGAA